MTAINHISRPTRKRVAPRQRRRAPGLQRNYRVGFLRGVRPAVAHDVVGCDAVDGAVVGGDADAGADGVGVDGHHDGVRRGGGG